MIILDDLINILAEAHKTGNFIWVMNYNTYLSVRRLKDGECKYITSENEFLGYGLLFGKIIGIDDNMKDDEIKTIKI